MRNFVLGLLLGCLATYWYLTQGDSLRATIGDLWEQASAPPESTPAAPAHGRR